MLRYHQQRIYLPTVTNPPKVDCSCPYGMIFVISSPAGRNNPDNSSSVTGTVDPRLSSSLEVSSEELSYWPAASREPLLSDVQLPSEESVSLSSSLSSAIS